VNRAMLCIVCMTGMGRIDTALTRATTGDVRRGVATCRVEHYGEGLEDDPRLHPLAAARTTTANVAVLKANQRSGARIAAALRTGAKGAGGGMGGAQAWACFIGLVLHLGDANIHVCLQTESSASIDSVRYAVSATSKR